MTDDWRHSGERLARVEERLKSVDEKLTALPEMAKSINSIQIRMAAESGRRSTLRYVVHAASVLLAGLVGAFTEHHTP